MKISDEHNRGKTVCPGMTIAGRVAECDAILLRRKVTVGAVRPEKIRELENNGLL